MKTIGFLFIVVVSNVCTALYASPNYRYVVAPKLNIRYTQPAQTYALPQVRVPAIRYGLPGKTVEFNYADVTETRQISPAKPSEVYGVPSLKIPSTSYGVPFERVPVPRKSTTYTLEPNLNTFDIDFDDYGDDSVDVAPQKPATTYGVPVSTPSQVYGVPVRTSIKFVSVKAQPAQRYALPNVRSPAVVYGVPNNPSSAYGAPSVRVPATEYGLF